MKRLFLPILLLFTLNTSSAADRSWPYPSFIRGHLVYLAEVLDDESEDGYGFTFEFGSIFRQHSDFSQALSFEVGYFHSDTEYQFAVPVFETVGVDIDVTPLLFNYTISGNIAGSFIWEAGGGLGAYIIDSEADYNVNGYDNTDTNLAFGGQFFGRVGYWFGNDLDVTAGIRYMVSDEFSQYGIEESLSTVAFDLSASWAF